MAHYHFTARIIRRKAHRCVTQVAAYKFGHSIECIRTEQTYSYPRMDRVIRTATQAPRSAPEWVYDRSALWNAVELRETRKDSQVAREFELGLPIELGKLGHIAILERFADYLVERFDLVVDWVIQMPRKESDQRNMIAVMLMPTRRMEDGVFTTKLREMSVLPEAAIVLKELRALWADITNDVLEASGSDARVDHRTLADQKAEAEAIGDTDRAVLLDRAPQVKLDRQAFQARRKRMLRLAKAG